MSSIKLLDISISFILDNLILPLIIILDILLKLISKHFKFGNENTFLITH